MGGRPLGHAVAQPAVEPATAVRLTTTATASAAIVVSRRRRSAAIGVAVVDRGRERRVRTVPEARVDDPQRLGDVVEVPGRRVGAVPADDVEDDLHAPGVRFPAGVVDADLSALTELDGREVRHGLAGRGSSRSTRSGAALPVGYAVSQPAVVGDVAVMFTTTAVGSPVTGTPSGRSIPVTCGLMVARGPTGERPRAPDPEARVEDPDRGDRVVRCRWTPVDRASVAPNRPLRSCDRRCPGSRCRTGAARGSRHRRRVPARAPDDEADRRRHRGSGRAGRRSWTARRRAARSRGTRCPTCRSSSSTARRAPWPRRR